MLTEVDREVQCEHKPLPAFIGTQKAFVFLLISWFAGQALLRVLISGTANLDEAEQLMLTQDWALGYGPQPPLYTWLQATVFAVAGGSIAGLALLKNALLFGTYGFTYLNARLLTGRHEAAVAASLSLFLIPQIAWESQRDLTHSVLASMLALAALFCFLQAHRQQSTRWYLLLGLALGCGTLAKYNFTLWAAGLLLGALSLRAFRPVVLNWRMALALAVAILIVAPHAGWALKNTQSVTQKISKFQIAARASAPDAEAGAAERPVAAGPLGARAASFLNMVWAVARFITPLLAIHAALLWARRKPWRPPACEGATLLGRALIAVGLALVLLILVFAPTGFKDRWFQPVLVATPILLTACTATQWNADTLRPLWRIAALVMIAVALLIPGKLLLADITGRRERLNYPLPELSRQLASRISPGTVILAENSFIAGNLRLGMPGHRVICPEWGDPETQRTALVWESEKHPSPPPALQTLAEPSSATSTIITLQAPLRNQPAKNYSLRVLP